MAVVDQPTACAACGRALPVQHGQGRRRRYCDATCRSAARRQRQRITPSVKEKLTDIERHEKVNDMADSGTPGSAGPMAGQVLAVAGRFSRAGSPLDAVAAARELAAVADAALQESVDRARAAGHSWREIGDVLETTRQAAFQRFGRPVDPRTGQPMIREVLPGATDRAVAILGLLAAGRWDEVRGQFDATMTDRLSADELARGWAQVVGTIGALESTGEPAVTAGGIGTVVDIPLRFEAGDRTGRISFSPDGQVIGLFIRP
jgi:Protein of unknown function (DUF3887)